MLMKFEWKVSCILRTAIGYFSFPEKYNSFREGEAYVTGNSYFPINSQLIVPVDRDSKSHYSVVTYCLSVEAACTQVLNMGLVQ